MPAVGNLITSVALALAGLFCFAMLKTPTHTRRALQPWLAVSVGAFLCFLAADEGLELHDRVGRWLWREHDIRAPAPVNHVDDLIVLGYLLAGACIAVVALPPFSLA